MKPDEITTYLRNYPNEIEALVANLTDDQFRSRPAEDAWSIIELLCHLRDSAQEDGIRIRRLIEEDNPTLVPFDQEEWARDRRYHDDDPRKTLTALRAYWNGLAYYIESIPAHAWQRSGHHPEFGPRTVATQAQQTLDHAAEHLAQIRGVVETVG